MRALVVPCLLVALAGCGSLARDPFPGHFRYALLNGAREDLYERAIPRRTPSSAAAVIAPRAEVPPLPASAPGRAPPSGEVPPLPRPAPGAWDEVPPLPEPGLASPTLPIPVPARPAPAALARWLRHGEAPDMRRQRIAAFAASLVGLRRVVVNGRRFAANCSDFVRAVYSIEGIDLYRWPGRLPGMGGVRSLYALAKVSGGLHFRRTPLPGDLVFFHHTYDFNRNRRIDDFLSHVAVVEKVDGDGTVHYVDRSSGRVRRGRLNVLRPGLWRDPRTLKLLNSFLRRRSRRDPPGTRYLAGDLFAGFGTLLR